MTFDPGTQGGHRGDGPRRVLWREVEHPGTQVVPEAEVGAHGVGVALALLVAAGEVFLGGGAQLAGVESCTGEVRRLEGDDG